MKDKLFRISELLSQLNADSFAHNQSKVDSGLKIINNLLNMVIDECTPELPDPCTVEQWQQITGKIFPDDGYCLMKTTYGKWKTLLWKDAKNFTANILIYIVQTAKPAPEESDG